MDPAAFDRVEITNCRNGYARAVAYPPDEETMEALPVFLRKSDEDWHVVESGTGVDCADEGNLSPEMVAACQELGLP